MQQVRLINILLRVTKYYEDKKYILFTVRIIDALSDIKNVDAF